MHKLFSSSDPDVRDAVATAERRGKAFKSEGFGEIDEITYTEERNGVRVTGFKGSSMH